MFPYRPGVRFPIRQLFNDPETSQSFLREPQEAGQKAAAWAEGLPNRSSAPSSAVRSGNPPAWGGIMDEEAAGQVERDPTIAYAMLRAAQGKTGTDKSIFGAGRANRYGQAVQALATLGGDITPAAINAILRNAGMALNDGTGLGGMLQEAGAGAMGRDLSALSDPKRLAVLNALAGAATYSMPSLWRGTVTGPLEELEMQAIQQGAGNDTTGILTQDTIEGSPFWAAIQQLMGGTR